MTCENYLRLNTMCPLPILDINVDNKKKVTEFVNWCQMQKKLQQQQQENNSNIFKYCLIPEVVLKQGNNIDCIDYAYIFKHPLLGEGKFGGWNVCLLKSDICIISYLSSSSSISESNDENLDLSRIFFELEEEEEEEEEEKEKKTKKQQ